MWAGKYPTEVLLLRYGFIGEDSYSTGELRPPTLASPVLPRMLDSADKRNRYPVFVHSGTQRREATVDGMEGKGVLWREPQRIRIHNRRASLPFRLAKRHGATNYIWGQRKFEQKRRSYWLLAFCISYR